MKKKMITLLMSAVLANSMCLTAFAGAWEQAGSDWKHVDNGTYLTGWQWIDGKSYYFDGNGIMAKNTVIDGYELNADGQWIVNGQVQIQESKTENTGVNHSAGYDPARPLAGKIDEWNLRLSDGGYNKEGQICSNNVQAMLTNQMGQYFAAPVGEYVDSVGNHIYTTQEDFDIARKTEQDLYNWYCNWLNSTNFETMSEMDRAKEIQKVLGKAIYDDDGRAKWDSNQYKYEYNILINKKGICEEFARTAQSLSKALGLSCTVSGSGNHTWYYIIVDGKRYGGNNMILNLDTPVPETDYHSGTTSSDFYDRLNDFYKNN